MVSPLLSDRLAHDRLQDLRREAATHALLAAAGAPEAANRRGQRRQAQRAAGRQARTGSKRARVRGSGLRPA